MSVERIDSKTRLFDLKFKEIWQYRDLVIMFVRRDLAATYKQSILGPLWFFIQPLLTAITYTFIFGKVAGISTDGLPKIIFYLAGITIWSYFSECFTKTATVLKDNSALFGKVYFPRLILPLSICISALTRFGIQFLLFIGYVLYYTYVEHAIKPNLVVFATPFLLVLIAGFGLGGGILISSLTTRYRDLSYLITFGVQLLMFATPIIYTVDKIDPTYRNILMLNPLSPIIETFRYAFLGIGIFSLGSLMYSFFWMIVLLFTGIVVFNKVQKTFMDTI
jgi:lipopolysaccharide transport system permease protein